MRAFFSGETSEKEILLWVGLNTAQLETLIKPLLKLEEAHLRLPLLFSKETHLSRRLFSPFDEFLPAGETTEI